MWLTSTTEQWAVIAVQGPNARRVLEPLVSEVDVSAAALAYIGVARGKILGRADALVSREGFTGELGFDEINVPADYGAAVWEGVHAAGQAHGMVAYGTETMHVLRAEKGYIIVGQDTDGTVTPDDAGLSWAIGKNKADFVGKRSLDRPAMKAADRKQLVGLRSRRDGGNVLEEGAQVAAKAGSKRRPWSWSVTADLGLSEQCSSRCRSLALHARWSPRGRARQVRRCTCPCREGTSKSRSPRRFSMIPRRKAHQWLKQPCAGRRPCESRSAAEWLKTLPASSEDAARRCAVAGSRRTRLGRRASRKRRAEP